MRTTLHLIEAGCCQLAGRGLLLGLLLPLPAVAWNAGGHRLVACIAWDNLEQAPRSELAQLLREHPDYARWHRRAGDDDGDRKAFIEASTWPDEIRQDRRFYDAGIDAPTATRPGFPDMERRRDWHYVNRRLADAAEPQTRRPARSEPRPGRLDRQLVALAQTVGSSDAAGSQRSYALPWLIHLVGDAHQPLHASPGLDVQGDALTVANPFNPRQASTTLHAFWDDLPGPPWLRGERLDDACRALIAAYPRPAPSRSAQWIDESWQLAQHGAYPPAADGVPKITAEFYENARQIAGRRIAEAGYRLADLLRELLGGAAKN